MEGIALGECEYKCMPNASDSDRNIVHSCFTKKKVTSYLKLKLSYIDGV